jgi:uncharacterized protein (DUF1697 family)
MNTYIGLLRGINVGGNNKLPMKELVTVLGALGLQKVETYIQSGNVVFQSERIDRDALSLEITEAIGRSHGFKPQMFLLTRHELQAAIDANPFPEAVENHKTLHLFFFDTVPDNPNYAAWDALKAANERYALIGNVFYLHAPDGIGRSQLAEKFGRGWKGSNTARNWRTVVTMMEMATALGT